MAITNIVEYTNPADFAFDADLIEVVGGKAKLKLKDLTGLTYSEDFADDTGFTYDSTGVEFVAGVLSKKDKTAISAIAGATFTSSKDLSWGKGFTSLTGTLIGGAVNLNQTIECFNGNKGCSWSDPVIGAMQRKGYLKFEYIPNYTGGPTANTSVISNDNGVNNNDRFYIMHESTGSYSLKFNVYNSTGGTVIGNFAAGSFSAIAGQRYVFEILWDWDDYGFRLKIDGVVIRGSMPTYAHIRGTSATIVKVGYYGLTPNYVADAAFDNLLIGNDNIEDENYTIPETIYAASIADIPTYAYTGLGVVQSVDNVTKTGTNPPDHTAINNSSSIVIRFNFLANNVQEDISNAVIEYTGQNYSMASPTIESTSTITADTIESFSAIFSELGNDSIKFVIKVGLLYFYYDGTNWVPSDKSLAQSNTAQEVHDNRAGIQEKSVINTAVLLTSDDGTTTPDITSYTTKYSYYNIPNVVNKCLISGEFFEVDTDIDPTARVEVFCEGYFHGDIYIGTVPQVFLPNSTGVIQFSLYETATIAKTMTVKIITGQGSDEVVLEKVVTIPDQDFIHLNDLMA